MSQTWTQMQTKAQTLAKTSNAAALVQLKEDMNTGYHMFNQKLSRYYARKQQFADLVESQQIYQTPIDCIRVMGMTVLVSNTYQPTLKEIRSEYEWRNITSYPMESNWPAYYYMLGNDELSLWPIPSQDVTNGLRFYYQQQDYDLSIEDVTSVTTGATVTVTNGTTTVTASSGVFTPGLKSLWFQLTGVTNLTWYEIVDVPNATTLTLKSAFVGTSGSAQAWRIGQISIIPPEYADAPMHYALGNYFSAQGNEGRSQFHLGTEDNPGMFWQLAKNCSEDYSSSNQSSVITDNEGVALNIWKVPPPASPT